MAKKEAIGKRVKRIAKLAKEKAAPQTEEEKIREMAHIGSPDEEIASVMGCTVEWLRKQYGTVIDAVREERKEWLRQQIAKLTPEEKKQAEREIRSTLPGWGVRTKR